MAYTKYSLTPANNTAAPPDGAPEGMLPSAVNDTMRDMMAQIRDVGDGVRDGTYTMTAPKITGGTITGSAITSSSYNGTVGSTTASTGAFTSITASTTLGITGVATFSAGTVSLPAITTTGDTNTGVYFPAADTIAFTEGGVESMRIDSSGNVLLGATSQAGTTSRAYIRQATDGNFEGLSVVSSSAAQFVGGFSMTSSGILNISQSYLGGSGSYQPISFTTSGSERMRLPTDGGVQAVTTISVGNATPSASGAGITFPATQSASTDVNTLDDYEEGTFTPILGTSNGDTATMSVQEGKYIKVGKIVQFSIQVVWTAKNTWSFNTRISGLPFTATLNTGGYIWPNACQMDANVLTTLFIYGIESNTTIGYIQAINVTGAQLTESSFPSSGRVLVNGCYQTT